MLTNDTFRAEVEGFLKETGMAASAFGKAALADPSFVHELRKGRAPSLKTVERIHGFMRAQKASETARVA